MVYDKRVIGNSPYELYLCLAHRFSDLQQCYVKHRTLSHGIADTAQYRIGQNSSVLHTQIRFSRTAVCYQVPGYNSYVCN